MADNISDSLPADYERGRFLGRAQSPDGPCVILIEQGNLYDLTNRVASVSGAIARRAFDGGTLIGPVTDGLPEGWSLLSPIDLQCIKAAGVTFALSAIERVIEEQWRDPDLLSRELVKDVVSIVAAVVAPHARMISSHDEVRAPVVPADEGVENRLPRPRVSHRGREY